MGVLEDIKEQYPTLAFLINDPEVGPLLKDAVDPNKGFSPQAFQAKLYQTKWFRTRSTNQRQIDILRQTDPGEYRRQYNEYVASLRAFAAQSGLKFTNPELAYIAGNALRNGVKPNTPEFQALMRNYAVSFKGDRLGQGSIRGAMLEVSKVARQQFYVPMTAKEQQEWATDLALGIKDESALKAYLSERSASRYPHLKNLLQGGASMEDIFGGHRALIAEELEISPETIDFTKGQWSKVLHQIDPATEKPRPMTLHEAQTLARQDNRWWATTNGRETDAGMTNFLLKTFGKRA